MLPRHAVLVLSLLAALATPGCHRNATPRSKALSNITAPQVIEWLLGGQVRGPKSSNRGHVGVVIYDLSAAKPTSDVLPDSCALGLTRIIPTPNRAGTRFAINEAGQILRHNGAGWSAVPAPEPLPSIDELIAFSTASARLELLVRTTDDQRGFILLVFKGEEIAEIAEIDPTTFYDRRETLQRYDSGRCLDGVRDCLHLVAIDGDHILMREPELFDNHEELLPLDDGARDVRYASPDGTMLDVLTTAACAPEEPTPTDEPEPVTPLVPSLVS